MRSGSAAQITDIFALNTDLVLNCVEGLSDIVANQRLERGGNSVAYLLAHIIDTRFYTTTLLGARLDNPLAPVLDNAGSIDEVGTLPATWELLESWQYVGAELVRLLDSLSDADLARAIPQSFPVPGGTLRAALSFLAQHESYHVGQIAFLRRQFGFPAMKYTRRISQTTS